MEEKEAIHRKREIIHKIHLSRVINRGDIHGNRKGFVQDALNIKEVLDSQVCNTLIYSLEIRI